MEIRNNFRDIIINLLKEKNWSRKEIAERTGIEVVLINAMLRGERRFNEDQVVAFAEAFNIEPYQLFITGKMVPESHLQALMNNSGDFREKYDPVIVIDLDSCGSFSDISTIPASAIKETKLMEKSLVKDLTTPFLAKFSGDGMFPTLSNGDSILFDCSTEKRLQPNPNNIFLLNLAPESDSPHFKIARASYSPESQNLLVIPDNRRYRIERHSINPKKSPMDYILAEAVWSGKHL